MHTNHEIVYMFVWERNIFWVTINKLFNIETYGALLIFDNP